MKEKCINNNIQKFRQEKKMTQEELAEKVGVTRQTIISIEKGNYAPSLLLAFSFGVIFNKKIEDIFWLE